MPLSAITEVSKPVVVANGISLQNSSGWYVLQGHLESLVSSNGFHGQLVLLARADFISANNLAGLDGAKMLQVPNWTSGTIGRILFELFALPGIMRKLRADYLVQPSGYPVPFLKTRQLVIAQNPYPFVFRSAGSVLGRARNALLRGAYLKFPAPNFTIFPNSGYMKSLYRADRGKNLSEAILFQGVYRKGDEVSRGGHGLPWAQRERVILAVAEATEHKRLDLVLRSFAIVAKTMPELKLQLVGKIADESLMDRLRTLTKTLEIGPLVEFCGFVSREELLRKYAGSLAYVSFSECESFGIPAVEAQGFGTPAIIANCCAPPEICGAGACVVDEGDVGAAAEEITRLATDPSYWTAVAQEAKENARKYEWGRCSEPLVKEILNGR